MSEKCLIIGLGQIGMGYALGLDPAEVVYSHARAFSLHSAFELVAAVDPSAKQRALFERHYGLLAYADLENAQAAGVVVIASPTASPRVTAPLQTTAPVKVAEPAVTSPATVSASVVLL